MCFKISKLRGKNPNYKEKAQNLVQNSAFGFWQKINQLMYLFYPKNGA